MALPIDETITVILGAQVLNEDAINSTSTSLCKDNNIPLVVFGIAEPENIVKAVKGEKIGTIVKN